MLGERQYLNWFYCERVMYSIYTFWRDLTGKREFFRNNSSLMKFPFDYNMFSFSRRGRGFPTFSIRLNQGKSSVNGGELIKIKTRNKYSISPFKSSIPKGKVKTKTIFGNQGKDGIQRQMTNAGDDVFSLEERDVYYLVRGQKGKAQKICLVHGSFFETISTDELIRQSFGQVLDEKLAGSSVSDEVKEQLSAIFSEQEDFSRVRNVGRASVKLRFRILTEVKPEGNILNPKQYPEIVDDSLNFIVPYHSEEERAAVLDKMEVVMGKPGMKKFKTFPLKHPLNGWFIVFQVSL